MSVRWWYFRSTGVKIVYFPKVYFPKVYFPKVYFVKVCSPKVYLTRVYFFNVYFYKLIFVGVLCAHLLSFRFSPYPGWVKSEIYKIWRATVKIFSWESSGEYPIFVIFWMDKIWGWIDMYILVFNLKFLHITEFSPRTNMRLVRVPIAQPSPTGYGLGDQRL